MSPQKTDSTHFGYETVSREEKTARVRGVFDSVASRYDVMNDVMSAGLHRIWKRHMVASLALVHGQRVLDLAGGTGDIAFLIAHAQAVDITVCDINAEMLSVGQERAAKRSIAGLEWVCGNAEALPFPSDYFDRCTIAFGIRNVTDIPAALASIYRCLKPGGMFACLEFSKVNPAFEKIYDAYSFNVIPRLGGMIGGDRAAYQYLVESIRRFPSQWHFKQMLEEAGFERVSYENLSAGVVALHRGWKL